MFAGSLNSLWGLAALLLTGSCAAVPFEQSGSLSSYKSLAPSDGILTRTRVSANKDELLAAKTVGVAPTSFSESASRAGLSQTQRDMVANAIDRSMCIGLAERFHVDNQIANFAARLPSGDADILWEVYRTKKPQILDADAAAENARLRALSALTQPDLDASALRAAFKEAMDSRMHKAELIAEAVVDALERISPDSRRQLASQIHSAAPSYQVRRPD